MVYDVVPQDAGSRTSITEADTKGRTPKGKNVNDDQQEERTHPSRRKMREVWMCPPTLKRLSKLQSTSTEDSGFAKHNTGSICGPPEGTEEGET